MSLRDYARKRRFDQTPEPDAQSARRQRGKAPVFVVQLHHARARHYDFRLELDGVLKSWAVPKGPSLRAGEKRLAVEVEDHPLDYARFHGDIPAGQYGAGHVDIFDHGHWQPEGDEDPLLQLAAGKLDFRLDGQRLHGRFTLVRTGKQGRQPQWLLIKRSDAHARDIDADGLLQEALPPAPPARKAARPRAAGKLDTRSAATAPALAKTPPRRKKPSSVPDWQMRAAALPGAQVAPMPDTIAPQLARARATPPAGDDWLCEIKWDGYRLLARCNHGEVQLASRNGLPWVQRLPRQANALRELPVTTAVLDTELVALDSRGGSDFPLLQRQLERGDSADLRLVAFDLLYLDGVDLRDTPLAQRRALLQSLIDASASPLLAFSAHVQGSPRDAFAASGDAGLEGVICKRADAPYRSGRSDDWIKLKHVADESFRVVGFTAPRNSRKGFGSLLLADDAGGALEYMGRVGSGFSDDDLRRIGARLKPLQQRQPTVALPDHVPFTAGSVRWVDPALVVDVRSRGRGKEGLLRQASFVRLREDRSHPRDPTQSPQAAAPAQRQTRPPGRSAHMATPTITHPERIVFPGTGISKQDVADYYSAVARWLLPQIAQRPLSLLRCPDGIGDGCFFQKHQRAGFGADVHVVHLAETSGSDDYMYVDNVQGVLSLVQMGTIELHPWGARQQTPDRPDRLVFDLDPDEGIDWTQIRKAAVAVRDRLLEVGLESWPRLSGGKGIHVCVPLNPAANWPDAKAFCEAFANAMATQSPMHYVATASKQARRGRIFIDWLRNTRGATSVAGWSLRARAGAPVAMPLRWDELARTHSGTDYDLSRAKRRAASLRSDPWEGFDTLEQVLPQL